MVLLSEGIEAEANKVEVNFVQEFLEISIYALKRREDYDIDNHKERALVDNH